MLRAKGYYGDGNSNPLTLFLRLISAVGMYSSGSRLSDSAQIAGRGLGADDFDLPEYMCGGAQERQRSSTLR